MAEERVKYDILLIGGSAGSLEVLLQLIPAIPADFSIPIVIVLHRRNSESLLAGLLGDRTPLTVKEVDEKETIEAGTIYLAPADYHLLIEEDRTFSLDVSEKVNYCRPSIDVTFESACEVYKERTIGLLLSGANADGTQGLRCIKEKGGLTIVQNPSEASVAYMPQQAMDGLSIDYVLDTEDISKLLQQLHIENIA